MNLYVFRIHVSLMLLLLQCALSKTLPEANEIGSVYDVSHSSDDTDSLHETNHGIKHSDTDRHRGHSRKRRGNDEKPSIKKQCAVMYKNDEPVGILQPYKDSFQFLPVHSEEQIPVDISPFSDSQNSFKRDTSLNTEDDEDVPEIGDETLKKRDSSQFSDERYPYIFAKFKVDSRIEKSEGSGINKQRTLHKRESSKPLFNGRHADSLSSTLSRIQSNDEGAEVELRNILNDMGLIEDDTHVDKREAELNEDEDLEHGTNKINLIKLDKNEERLKREDLAEKSAKRIETATKHYEMIEIPEPKSINEEEYIDQYLNKNDQPEQENKKDIEKRSDEVAAEMEREIKSKLQKIKEEVRNEIDKIKNNNNEEFEEMNEDGEEQAQEKEKLQRRKRNVINTLVDEETSDINPVINADSSLVPHIRRRRSIIENDVLPDSGKKDDLSQKFEKITNEVVTSDSQINSKSGNASNTAVGASTTGTNLVIDFNPEDQNRSISDSENIVKRKYDINSAIIVSEKEHSNLKNSKPYQRLEWNDKNKGTYLKGKQIKNEMFVETNNKIMDQITNMDYEVKSQNIKKRNQILEGNSSYGSRGFSKKHFLIRNLKEYDDDRISGEDENELNFEGNDRSAINDNKNLNREKKGCKCENGGKDCKCKKNPIKLLEGSDGSNFVYVDDVPRLSDRAPLGQISNEKEDHEDKESATVKMKLLPLPRDKKRATKGNIQYRKSRINFQKSLRDGGYTLDIDPDIYKITEENSQSFITRRKRNSFSDLVAIHGGGPVINHLIAIKERSMLPRVRVKRKIEDNDEKEQLTLTDMSSEDLFGALPQSFDGELARYKRVKRSN